MSEERTRQSFASVLRAAANDPHGYEVGELLSIAADRLDRLQRALAVPDDRDSESLREALRSEMIIAGGSRRRSTNSSVPCIGTTRISPIGTTSRAAGV